MENARWAYALLGIGFILLLLGFGAFSSKESPADPALHSASAQLPRGQITIASTTVAIEIAETPEDRARGLSGRVSLADGEGLFFIFETEGEYGFWMPDMHFAIDMIWLNDDFDVVYIKENATPESYPTVFQPTMPVRYVLEVPAFYAAEQGITLDSRARFVRNP